jgi:hypothetical protein
MRNPAQGKRPAQHPAPSNAGKASGFAAPGFIRRARSRLFKRSEATTFHRCLALHMFVSASRSALD